MASLAPGQPFTIVSNDCGGRIAAGGGCDVTIAFAPRNGPAQSELRIAAAAGNLAAHATISGTGFVPQQAPPPPETAHLDIESRALHFLSGITPPQKITLSNPSAMPITIHSVKLDGGDRTFRHARRRSVPGGSGSDPRRVADPSAVMSGAVRRLFAFYDATH